MWNVGGKEPQPSDHVYYPINRQETFATLTIAGLFPGVIYNIKVLVTGIGLQLNSRQRTSKYCYVTMHLSCVYIVIVILITEFS